MATKIRQTSLGHDCHSTQSERFRRMCTAVILGTSTCVAHVTHAGPSGHNIDLLYKAECPIDIFSYRSKVGTRDSRPVGIALTMGGRAGARTENEQVQKSLPGQCETPLPGRLHQTGLGRSPRASMPLHPGSSTSGHPPLPPSIAFNHHQAAADEDAS